MKSIFAALCSLLTISTFAQKSSPAIFCEVGGAGLASINFDTRFSGNKGFGVRVGISAGLATISGVGVVIMPLELNYITSKNQNSFLELGLGTIFYNGENGKFQPSVGFFEIGYRYAPAIGGLFFRINYTPAFMLKDKKFYPLWGGISLGYKF